MSWPPDPRVCILPRCDEPSARTQGVEDARCLTHAIEGATADLNRAKAHHGALLRARAANPMPGQMSLITMGGATT